MNRQEILNLLKSKGIEFELTEHKAVYNMEELSQIEVPYPEADAKNLFVRDDKRRNYYLITVKGDKRVDLKKFRRDNQLKPLSFASPEELMAIMGLTPGSVSPFGVLNDKNCAVTVFIDSELLNAPGLIGVHPNDNTATIWLKTADLIDTIRNHGNSVFTVSIAEIGSGSTLL